MALLGLHRREYRVNEKQHHIKTLGAGDMTLFTVSAILLLDTLATSAAIGVSSITWWFILGVVFLVPYCLMNAELGTTYPEQGGLYAWIRDMFGARWGTRLTWLYWFNTILWNCSVLVMFAGVLAQMFFPDMSLGIKIAITIAVSWLVVALTVLSLRIGKWIPNAGAIIKMIAFGALIAGGIAFAGRDNVELANDFSLSSFVPEWGASTQYITTIVYGMLGFELMSSAAEEMKDPTRDIPRAVFWSALVIFLAYTLGTFAILAAIPVDEINLVEGLVDTFRTLFGESQLGAAAALVLGGMVLFTFFSNTVTWSIGCNRAAAEAANDGELPKILAIEHRVYGTPLGAAVIMGILMTIMLIVYGLQAESNAELFWMLLATSAVIYLMPYIGLCAAFFRARQVDADRPRPFRVAGGQGVAFILAHLCIVILAIMIFLFMYVPGEGFDWPVVAGSIASILLGEAAIRYAERERRTHDA